MQQLLQQKQKQPLWIEKAQSISILTQIRKENFIASQIDENWHEYKDTLDERALCNSFICHDPSQINDKSEMYKNWQNFVENQKNTCAHTILDDLPEDRPQKQPEHAQKRSDSPYTKMSTLTLRHLELCGDKRATKLLTFRDGKLTKALDTEIIFEYGEMQNNGNLLVKTGYAGTVEAAYYRAATAAR
jgi:hypothetical protein